MEQQHVRYICHLSYTANMMSADALATLGASASAGMVLTHKTRDIPSPTSEESSVK